jgi:hypothetical protein
MLTDLTIRTAKSRENPYKLHDGEGLYLSRACLQTLILPLYRGA